MAQGKVKWFNDAKFRFGLSSRTMAMCVFVHFSAIQGEASQVACRGAGSDV